MNNSNFVSYEYKNVAVKRGSATMYMDCLENFGWTLAEERGSGYMPLSSIGFAHDMVSYTSSAAPDKMDDLDMITLKFKRDRRLNNKREIDKLERQCEEALAAINKLERKNSAQTMSASLGTGIVGTGFLVLATYNFVLSNIVLGVLFTAVGAVGWAVGFFANRKIGIKKAAQTEPMIQQQYDAIYSACEQAHALLA